MKEVKVEYAPTVVTPTGIAEEVWDRENPPYYVLRRFDSNKIETVNEVETGEVDRKGRLIVYRPVEDENLREKVVLLPTGVEEATPEECFEEGVKLALEIYDCPQDRVEEFKFFVACAQSSWFLDKYAPNPKQELAGMGKFAPILAARGPAGSGKGRFVNALRLNAYRPIYMVSSKRVPSIFRPMALWRGTLCVDECDVGNVGEDSDILRYFNDRCYGVPFLRQDPNNPRVSQVFHNFGLSVVAQRRPWPDDAIESRTLPFLCDKVQKRLPTVELEEWVERGLRLQNKLLYVRLTLWDKVRIDKKAWVEGVTDYRLVASTLPLLALARFARRMVERLTDILKELDKRRKAVRAISRDGVIVNFIWDRIEESCVAVHNGYPYLTYVDEESGEAKPLTASRLAQSLRWSPSEVRRVIQSLRITPEDAPKMVKISNRVYRPVFVNPSKLEVLLREFVVDYEPLAVVGKLGGLARYIIPSLLPTHTLTVTSVTSVTDEDLLAKALEWCKNMKVFTPWQLAEALKLNLKEAEKLVNKLLESGTLVKTPEGNYALP
ncbi:MAG: hypothetical protein QXR81_06835 [Candidatus Nezhaarchaeales archaeon]